MIWLGGPCLDALFFLFVLFGGRIRLLQKKDFGQSPYSNLGVMLGYRACSVSLQLEKVPGWTVYSSCPGPAGVWFGPCMIHADGHCPFSPPPMNLYMIMFFAVTTISPQIVWSLALHCLGCCDIWYLAVLLVMVINGSGAWMARMFRELSSSHSHLTLLFARNPTSTLWTSPLAALPSPLTGMWPSFLLPAHDSKVEAHPCFSLSLVYHRVKRMMTMLYSWPIRPPIWNGKKKSLLPLTLWSSHQLLLPLNLGLGLTLENF